MTTDKPRWEKYDKGLDFVHYFKKNIAFATFTIPKSLDEQIRQEEVKAREQAIRNILIKVYNLNRPLQDARAYETMEILSPLIEELEEKQ